MTLDDLQIQWFNTDDPELDGSPAFEDRHSAAKTTPKTTPNALTDSIPDEPMDE